MFRACRLFLLATCLLISSNALAQMEKCIAMLNAIENGDKVEIQDLADAIRPIIAHIGKDFIDAASRGDLDPIKAGLFVGVKVDVVNEALNIASGKGHLEVVQFLVKTVEGIDVNAKGRNGETPLINAVKNGHEEVAQWLINMGRADVNARSVEGRTALMHAIENGHNLLVLWLVGQDAIDINAKDINNKTALMYAVERGNREVMEWLLLRGADVNARDAQGRTVLMYAVYITQYVYAGEPVLRSLLDDTLFIIKSLLTAGADINAIDTNGRTALMHARHPMYGMADIIKLLLEKGAEVNTDATLNLLSRDKDFYMFLFESGYGVVYKDDVKHLVKEESHLHLAFEKFGLLLETSPSGVMDITHEDVIKGLIAIGSSDNNSNVSLHSRQFALKSLLTAGVDIDARDEADRTVLMHASFNRYLEDIVQQLIDAGANVNARDAQGRTALMYASAIGNTKIVEKLLAAGADVSAKDAQDRTASVYANSTDLYTEIGIKIKYDISVDDESRQNIMRLLSSARNLNARGIIDRAYISNNRQDDRHFNPIRALRALLERQGLDPTRMRRDDN